jgi:hypothetical protein
MVLRRPGNKDGDAARSSIKLHKEELHKLYASPHIIRVIKCRRMRLVGHVARMGEIRNVCNILVGKPEGRKPLERPRRKLAQDRKSGEALRTQ